MDNIQKFEDFLDRLQGLLDNAKKQGHIIVRVEDLENAFPELKESEEEVVRKEIIAFLKENYETGRAEETWSLSGLERWIAWLEKQNHDGKKWIYEDAYLKEKEQLIQDGIDEVLENPQKYGLEKQGEQKPAWSKEDEAMCQETIDWFEQKCFPYALEEENPAKKSIQWLKSLKERLSL